MKKLIAVTLAAILTSGGATCAFAVGSAAKSARSCKNALPEDGYGT